MKMTGNTILITGGTSGIGLGFAEEFLRQGNKVIICARRQDRLDQIKAKHKDITVKQCDVSQAGQREDLFRFIEKDFPETNVLINNAGVQLNIDILEALDLKSLNAEIETNFTAPIHLSSLFSGFLKRKSESAIINISSGLAFAPLAFMPVYCATKAALHSYTLSLRHQLRKTSIKVFEIAPPAVDTKLGDDGRADASKSHGGISVADFLGEAMTALEKDVFEVAIGEAKGLRLKREELFPMMNRAD